MHLNYIKIILILFNPSTNIRFAITKYSEVRISIFDLLGREIFIWNSNESLKPGIYEYLFIGENLSSGVYIYRFTCKVIRRKSGLF
ncbi:MAG: T9SS type A sorting domain-containing protein [Ignavibacteria bacterium]|nr:T9SS type A sorting domain-containing protein [Ignavibacteria bacterium]